MPARAVPSVTATVPLQGVRRAFVDGGNGHDVLKLAALPWVTRAAHVVDVFGLCAECTIALAEPPAEKPAPHARAGTRAPTPQP